MTNENGQEEVIALLDDFDQEAPQTSFWPNLSQAEWRELRAAATVAGKGLLTAVNAAGTIWQSSVSLQHHHDLPEHSGRDVEGSGPEFFTGAIVLSVPTLLGGVYDIVTGLQRIHAVYAAHGRGEDFRGHLVRVVNVYSSGYQEHQDMSR